MLRGAMYVVCSFRVVDLRVLVEEQEFEHCEGPEASMNLVLADLTFNIRPVQDDENSNHDIFAFAKIKAILQLCRDMQQPGEHNHIFYSVL